MPAQPHATHAFERWLVIATCTAAIVVAWAALEPAFAQTFPAQGSAPQALRGTSGGASAPDAAPVAGDPVGPINYGKPRKKKKNPTGVQNKRPLPALQAYPTAPGGRLRGSVPLADQPVPAPTIAAIPAPAQARRPAIEPNPYAPLGVNVGSLRLTPFVEGGIGYDTNPNRDNVGARASGFARVDGGFGLESDWSQHQLRGSLRAGYQEYFKDRDASRPDGAAALAARIDVTRDTTVDLDAKASLDTQRPGSTVTVLTPAGATARGRPLIATYGAGAGVTERFGRLAVNLRGTVDRTAYENATLTDGTTLDLSVDNYTQVGGKLRVGYEATPGITPFVEVFVDTRKHDSRTDASGYARDSNGAGARAGSTFEISRVLTGEASVGYGRRNYDDSRLADLRGVIGDASLAWSVTPLTTLTLRAGTDLAETNQAGATGAVVRRAGLEVSHALLRNLNLSGAFTYQNTDYTGISRKDDSYAAALKAEYSLTRSVVLRTSFTHERLKSTAPGNDYTANVFLLGLRLQQ